MKMDLPFDIIREILSYAEYPSSRRVAHYWNDAEDVLIDERLSRLNLTDIVENDRRRDTQYFLRHTPELEVFDKLDNLRTYDERMYYLDFYISDMEYSVYDVLDMLLKYKPQHLYGMFGRIADKYSPIDNQKYVNQLLDSGDESTLLPHFLARNPQLIDRGNIGRIIDHATKADSHVLVSLIHKSNLADDSSVFRYAMYTSPFPTNVVRWYIGSRNAVINEPADELRDALDVGNWRVVKTIASLYNIQDSPMYNEIIELLNEVDDTEHQEFERFFKH